MITTLDTTIPVSKTKVISPTRRKELLLRPRLLDLMYELLDKRLLLITAPAGYGKTSLLIDLAHQCELPFCWLALDVLDKEPQRFITYFIASLAERFPKFGRQSSAMLNNLVSLDQDAERLIVTLVNELYDQVHEHFLLAIDDYHLVHDIPVIQSFIGRFIELADENCHLILSSRALVNLPDLSLMVARNQVSGLDFFELAFRTDEIQALLAQNYHLSISDKVAQELAQETEGWITGLQLSGLGMVQGATDRLRLARASGVDLFDYLGQQVLEQQPPALRDFLLRSSLLGEFDAELCEAVLGPLSPQPQDWQGLINAVLHYNLFALPVGPNDKWLRYHHLFQEFLQTRLREEKPEQINSILFRLAQVHEGRGGWEKAYHLYKQLGDMDALANMIERAGTSMIQSALITLGNWLDGLPPSLVQARPGLISLLGIVACMKGDLHGGLAMLNQAEAKMRAQGGTASLALTLIRKAIAHRYLGEYEASLRDAEEVTRLTEREDELQAIYAEALRVKGLSLYRLGQSRQATKFLERSLTLHTNLNDKHNIPILLMETGMVYRAIGNYSAAKLSYEKALDIWREEGNLSWQANLLNNLGVLYQYEGEYEKAASTLEEGLRCAQRSSYTRMEALILISLGDLYTELEEYEVTHYTYQQAREIVQYIADRFLTNYLILAKTNTALLQKNLDEARRLLNEVQVQVQDGGSGYECGLYTLIRGRLFLMEGNTQQAILNLQKSEHYFSQDGRELENIWSKIWLAAALYQSGDNIAARNALQASVIGEGYKPHSIYMIARQASTWLAGLRNDPEVGRAISSLLIKVDQLEIKLPAIRRKLRRLTSIVPVPPPQLIIQALGRVQVKVNGKAITMSKWQTRSVRDLFFYFLSRSQPATKEQVEATLWPDTDDPQRLGLRFKNEIYRLRRAIGQDTILFEDERYHFNRSLDHEYDVEAFEMYLAQAKSAREAQEQIEHYQKAVDLVHGPYLADVDASWAWPEREHLNQAYISALLKLSELYLESGHPEKALTSCRRTLDQDACLEEAHCLAMRIYAIMDDRSAIARQYQACKYNLQTELGLPPSRETEELYHRLTI